MEISHIKFLSYENIEKIRLVNNMLNLYNNKDKNIFQINLNKLKLNRYINKYLSFYYSIENKKNITYSLLNLQFFNLFFGICVLIYVNVLKHRFKILISSITTLSCVSFFCFINNYELYIKLKDLDNRLIISTLNGLILDIDSYNMFNNHQTVYSEKLEDYNNKYFKYSFLMYNINKSKYKKKIKSESYEEYYNNKFHKLDYDEYLDFIVRWQYEPTDQNLENNVYMTSSLNKYIKNSNNLINFGNDLHNIFYRNLYL